MRFLRSGKPHTTRRLLLPLIVLAIVIGIFYHAVNAVSESTTAKQKEALRNAIDSDVTCCYSIEGSYPEDIQYLEDNYGLTYDHEKFFVGYRLQGSNIRPDITIIDLEGGGPVHE